MSSWILPTFGGTSVVRGQESGVRSQESGVRSQESGVRSQESGVRKKKPGASALRLMGEGANLRGARTVLGRAFRAQWAPGRRRMSYSCGGGRAPDRASGNLPPNSGGSHGQKIVAMRPSGEDNSRDLFCTTGSLVRALCVFRAKRDASLSPCSPRSSGHGS
jgi:hypothetical protein